MPILKPKLKRVTVRKPIIKKQVISKTSVVLAQNRAAIENAIRGLKKDIPTVKEKYKKMLDIVSKSLADIESARNILITEKMSESKINEILEPLINKRKQFLYPFNQFVENAISAQKNKALSELNFIKFTEAEIVADSYNRTRAELISKIAKLATKSK
jgi:BMFP domain-containing protein YqiC